MSLDFIWVLRVKGAPANKLLQARVMDSFEKLQPGEQLLRQERIHKGIFVIPMLTMFAMLVPAVPIAYLVVQLSKAISTFGPPSAPLMFLCFPSLVIVTAAMLPALAIFVLALIAYLKCEIILTSKRLMYRTGFVFRAAGELPLENIDTLFILEPLLGRLLGYGTVIACSLGGTRFPLSYIAKPQMFHAALQKAVTRAKMPTPKNPPPPQDDSRYLPKG
jgi:uncharacterized membrane protein YdbT with pleckstrin-like domain